MFGVKLLTCHLPEWFSPDLEQEELEEMKDLEVSPPQSPNFCENNLVTGPCGTFRFSSTQDWGANT